MINCGQIAEIVLGFSDIRGYCTTSETHELSRMSSHGIYMPLWRSENETVRPKPRNGISEVFQTVNTGIYLFVTVSSQNFIL